MKRKRRQLGAIDGEILDRFDKECKRLHRVRTHVVQELIEKFLSGEGMSQDDAILILRKDVKEMKKWIKVHNKHHGFKE